MMLHSLTAAAALLASLFAPAGPQQGAPTARFDPGSLPALDLSPGQGVAADVDGGYRPDPAVRRKLADIMGDWDMQYPKPTFDPRRIAIE